MQSSTHPAIRFFLAVIRLRWLILPLSLLLLVALGSQIGKLTKNTEANAFINENEPALVYRDKVEQIFNLKDPVVVAVVNRSEQGIYNRQTLELVRWLTEHLKQVDNIDPEGITSLATESNIEGDDAGMAVEEFLDKPLTLQRIDWIKSAISDFPLYQGSLVARDGSATLVVAELIDQKKAEETYRKIMDLVAQAPTGSTNKIHVAGEGAVAGYLSSYIDQDARKLNPLAGVIITLILVFAFRTLRGAVIPNLIVGGTVAATLGAMAGLGVEFFVITNGLIVCMIGIAVADSIHIFSEYYERLAEEPELTVSEAVASAMAAMWRPISLTSLTTAAGFLALYPTNDMPPLQYFGLFGAFAVAMAWLLTMFVTPALLSMLKNRLSRPVTASTSKQMSSLARVLAWLSLKNSNKTLAVAAVLVVIGIFGATQVVVNEERIENFQPDEPLYVADKVINRHLDGTHYVDVVIQTDQPEGIYKPEVLHKIEALQNFLQSQPAIYGTTSIADYIKQMHKAVNENRPEAYRIPDNANLIAQLFLLYTASGDPTDMEEAVDAKRQTALVRARLRSGSYQISETLIPRLQAYLDHNFGDQVQAHLSGRVNVDYHWISGVAQSHLNSVLVSFLAVLVMAALLFRSVVAGIMAAIPVGLAILVIYAVMGWQGIWLGVGTSMFAAIAIGLSVDFAIHTIDRLKTLLAVPSSEPLEQRLMSVFRSTGRSLWFNLLAVGLGFGVLMTSQVPPLANFGLLVALSVSIAFAASLILLPAIALKFRPAFLFGARPNLIRTVAILALVCALGVSPLVFARALPDADAIVAHMNSREEGQSVVRDMEIVMTDRNGDERMQRTRAFRRYFGETKKTAIFYTDPASVAGTAFLTWDYPNARKEDDQWLYLPALRKVRRISASDRGDYFLGTDFTYEEIKKESKIAAADYSFSRAGEETVDGHHTWVVEALPVSDKVKRALGYSRIRLFIDSENWIPRRSEYWDEAGNFLKTVHAKQIQNIDGIWSVVEIAATNHKTGHVTNIKFENTNYEASVPARFFTKPALKRGF